MDRGILEFVSLLSALIFKYGGRVIHGSHPSFTPVILRQARQHAGKRRQKPVTLVASDLWARGWGNDEQLGMADVAEIIVTRAYGDGSIDHTETRNRSLSAMREVLRDRENVLVAVGGRMHRSDGLNPGVLEEMRMAGERQLPRFLVGGLGGYARALAATLIPQELDNGLSADANLTLFTTNDVAACVGIIFHQLANEAALKVAATNHRTYWIEGSRDLASASGSVLASSAHILRVNK